LNLRLQGIGVTARPTPREPSPTPIVRLVFGGNMDNGNPLFVGGRVGQNASVGPNVNNPPIGGRDLPNPPTGGGNLPIPAVGERNVLYPSINHNRRQSPRSRPSIFSRITYIMILFGFLLCSGTFILASASEMSDQANEKDEQLKIVDVDDDQSANSSLPKAMAAGIQEGLTPGRDFLAAMLGAIKQMGVQPPTGLVAADPPAPAQYNPMFPGLKGESMEVLARQQRKEKKAVYEELTDEEEEDRKKMKKKSRRRRHSSSSSDGKGKSMGKGRKKYSGRRESPEATTSQAAYAQPNISNLVNALGRSAFHNRGLAAAFLRDGYSSHAIMARHWADSMTELKDKLLKDHRL